MIKPQKLDQLKLTFFFYFRRIFWTQTQQGSQSHQAWIHKIFCEKCTKKTRTISPSPSSRSPPLCPSSSRRTWQGRLQTSQVAIKKSPKKGRRERFLKTSPKVNGKVTTPVSRSMLIRAPTPRDPDGSKMLFLGEIKFF